MLPQPGLYSQGASIFFFVAFYRRCHGDQKKIANKSGVHIKLSWIETPERQSNYLIDLEHPLNDQVFDTYTTLKLNAQRQSSV